MTPLLKKIMAMVRKTGDRCIIVDPSGEEAFVLMDLGSYERMLITTPSPSPSMEGEKVRLTAKSSQDNIKPDKEGWENIPPAGAFSNGSDSFAELSEEKVLRDERFFIEPIE